MKISGAKVVKNHIGAWKTIFHHFDYILKFHKLWAWLGWLGRSRSCVLHYDYYITFSVLPKQKSENLRINIYADFDDEKSLSNENK